MPSLWFPHWAPSPMIVFVLSSSKLFQTISFTYDKFSWQRVISSFRPCKGWEFGMFPHLTGHYWRLGLEFSSKLTIVSRLISKSKRIDYLLYLDPMQFIQDIPLQGVSFYCMEIGIGVSIQTSPSRIFRNKSLPTRELQTETQMMKMLSEMYDDILSLKYVYCILI